MKVKSKPEDFLVEEKLAVSLQRDGEYEVYLLTKRGTNTIDVVKDISRRLNLSPKLITYCGLKDRHSVSKQFIAIPKGKGREIKAVNYETKLVGYLPHPLSPSLLLENRFTITVSSVSTPKELIEEEIVNINRNGLPNYYDSQRFGSARHGKGFAALEIVKGNYKKALKLILAEHSTFDPSSIKRFKRCIKENWGNFSKCLKLAPEPWVKRVLQFLAHRELSKSTAKRALGTVDEFTKNILINALQSYIWNLALAELVRQELPEENLLQIRVFDTKLPFPQNINWEPNLKELPTPSPRLKLEPPVEKLYTKALEKMGLSSVNELKSTVKGWLFKSHRRRTKIVPQVHYSVEHDPEHPGKFLWRLSFSLPSGSYATLVLKRIFWRKL